MKKQILFLSFAVLFCATISCSTKKESNSEGNSTDSISKSSVSLDTTKYKAERFVIDTTNSEDSVGYAAPPARAGKEAKKSWDNVFKSCSQYSQLSDYGDFLGVGSVQAIGQQMLKDDYQPIQNGVSFDINWFKPDIESAQRDIFPMGESNSENVISCTGKTGRKVSLNTLLGGKMTFPNGLNTRADAELKAAFERQMDQTIEVKWKRKEINVLVLPPYVESKSSSYKTADIYFSNLFKSDIITLTKGIVIESFKTKINVDGMTELGLKAAFAKDSTLALNGDFKLKIENSKEIFLECAKPFVIRGSFYQFKKDRKE